MALLTALLYGAGSYGRGRQQALKNKQSQEQIDNEQAYRQAEEKRQNAELAIDQQTAAQKQAAYNASIGLDPSGKPLPSLPKNLQRVMPMPVGPNYQATPQDQINHDYAVANFYRTHGDPYGNAEAYEARAAVAEKALLEGQSQAATLNRELAVAGVHANTEEQVHAAPTYADLNPKPLTPSEQRVQDQEQWNVAHGYPPGYTGNDIGAQLGRKATRLKGDFDEFWNNAISVPTTTNSAGMKIPLVDPKTRQPVAPVLSAQDQYDLKQEFAKMDESPDPEAYAKKLIASIPKAPEAIKKAIKLRADWREAGLGIRKRWGHYRPSTDSRTDRRSVEPSSA